MGWVGGGAASHGRGSILEPGRPGGEGVSQRRRTLWEAGRIRRRKPARWCVSQVNLALACSTGVATERQAPIAVLRRTAVD